MLRRGTRGIGIHGTDAGPALAQSITVFVGSSLDLKRAAAVAGTPVTFVPHVGYPRQSVVGRELNRGEGLVDISVEGNATLWVIFEIEPDETARVSADIM